MNIRQFKVSILLLMKKDHNGNFLTGGLISQQTEGTPTQGSSLSPLLSNIVLDEWIRS